MGLNPTSTSEIRNNDRSTRKGSGNSVQAAHIAEIAHRQSVGIPAKEWGSIPCFRSTLIVAISKSKNIKAYAVYGVIVIAI